VTCETPGVGGKWTSSHVYVRVSDRRVPPGWRSTPGGGRGGGPQSEYKNQPDITDSSVRVVYVLIIYLLGSLVETK